MASPQLKHGYAQVANSILDALSRNKTLDAKSRVMFWLLRNTYGWKDTIWTKPTGYGKMAKETGLKKPTVILALRVLVDEKVLVRDTSGRWKLQKNYDHWDLERGQEADPPGQKADPVRKPKERGQEADPPGQKADPHIVRAYIKDTTDKDIKDIPAASAGPQNPKPYPIDTPLQKVMVQYKMSKGVEPEDRVWDKTNWGRHVREASRLLEIFAGDWRLAARCIEGLGATFDEKNMSWVLATITKHAYDWKIANRERETHEHVNGAVDVRGGDGWARADEPTF